MTSYGSVAQKTQLQSFKEAADGGREQTWTQLEQRDKAESRWSDDGLNATCVSCGHRRSANRRSAATQPLTLTSSSYSVTGFTSLSARQDCEIRGVSARENQKRTLTTSSVPCKWKKATEDLCVGARSRRRTEALTCRHTDTHTSCMVKRIRGQLIFACNERRLDLSVTF